MGPEAKIEKAVCDWAKKHGILTFKFVSPAHRGVPDRIFFFQGKTALIEFKASGNKPTALQDATISDIRARDIDVAVIDNAEQGKAWLSAMLVSS